MQHDPLKVLFDEANEQEQREIHEKMKNVKLLERTPEEVRALARKLIQE